MSEIATNPHPAPEAVHDLVRRHLIGDGFEIVFDLERSHGSWIRDAASGREYLDFYSFFASLPLGFHHPALHRPESEERLLSASLHKPSNSDAHSRELAEFVECFAAHAMPSPFEHLFFVEGGALAVENALKTAFDWKVRKNLAAGREPRGSRVLHFRDAFHGRSGYTLSLTNTLPIKTAHFPKFDWPRVRNPALRFPVDAAETERVAAEERAALEEISAAFASHPDDIAAIIIEPVQGEGGDHHFRPEFFSELRRIADTEDALLIFDEVQSGFGLTGRFWAYEHAGVTPDIVAFGKKSQVCGIMAGPRVDDVPDNVFRLSSRINSTWGGGLVDMVRCQVVLETIVAEGLVENAAAVGEILLDSLHEVAAEHAPVTNVRGLGLMCAFDLPDPESRERVLAAALAEGVLILPCGKSSVRLRPALTLSEDEAVEGARRIGRALASA